MDRLTKTFLGLSAVGILVAAYHAYSEVTENFTSCNINSQVSCGNVFLSGYTSIFGIPYYLLGLVWFPLLLVVGAWSSRGGEGGLKVEALVPLLMVGNVFTIYLWYQELVVIGAVCPVCVSLYVLNYAMTAVAAAVATRGG